MSEPWRPGLSVRIVLFTAAIVALFGVLTVFAIGSIVTTQLRERYASDRQTSIEFLTASLVPMVQLGDYPRVERTIESVLVYENIVSLSVYDLNGSLIRTVSESGQGMLPTDTISHILTQDSEVIGRVDIGFSRAYIDVQVQELTSILALAVTTLLLATAAALLWYLSRSVVRPLNVFTRTVRSMTSDNLGLRVPLKGSDEIGVLAGSFNAMAEDLEESNRKLLEAHNRLEQRYQERAACDERRTEQVRRIFEMRQHILGIADLPDMLEFVASALQRSFSYDSVRVFLVEPDSADLRLSTAMGSAPNNGEARNESSGDSIVADVLKSGRPRLTTTFTHEPRSTTTEDGASNGAELAVPVAIGTLRLGVLDIRSDREDGLDEMDLFTAQTVADQIASVVESARVAVESRELAVLDERNRMAREIHDTLAQGFTGIVLQLEAAEQSLNDSPEQASRHIDRARSLARESLAEARRSVWALRPTALENGRLADALRNEVRSLAEEGPTKVTCHIEGDIRRLAPATEDALLRICQESLTNIRRHSRATAAQVHLTCDGSLVRLLVRDNGVGFDPNTPREGSFGLIGIRERARQCGGVARIASRPGEGTVVDVEIPIARRSDHEQDTHSDCG
ncbi:MAG: HAMP domain-containing protein [Dehalococcoidia bacterium]|nr:HAMP domain-containing protein [Dehalococcoidia bacterium]